MSYNELRKNIIDENLCTSCGLCVAVCPGKLLVINDKMIPVPIGKATVDVDNKECLNCGLCEEVCPGYDSQTSTLERNLFGRNRTEEERWIGIYKEAYKLTVTNARILKSSSSGGAGTVLAINALEECLVDAMLLVGRDAEKPWSSKPYLVDSPEKVVEYAQSTYCITPNLNIINKGSYKRIGIIGLPCQIQGVRKLMNIRNNAKIEKLSKKIILLIELACSSNTTKEGTEHIISNILNISLSDVSEVRYREGDYPGNFMVKTKDGKKVTYPFFKMVEEFKKFKTFRCNVCPDWWSGLADISISDGDSNVYALSRDDKKVPSSSTILTRTLLGQQLVNLIYKKGDISLLNCSFVNNLGLERKRQRYRYYRYNSDRKIPLPPSEEDYYWEDVLSDEEVLARGINT